MNGDRTRTTNPRLNETRNNANESVNQQSLNLLKLSETDDSLKDQAL